MNKIEVYDAMFEDELKTRISHFFENVHWKFGARSVVNPAQQPYPYWYITLAETERSPSSNRLADCSKMLETYPVIKEAWEAISSKGIFKDRILNRCYGNAYPYGSEGTFHLDSSNADQITAIYYPHRSWDINWAGETVFADGTQITASVLPWPNRLVAFPGNTPHAARAISRTCPLLRITLVFKGY